MRPRNPGKVKYCFRRMILQISPEKIKKSRAAKSGQTSSYVKPLFLFTLFG
jgi:hypothetical protein